MKFRLSLKSFITLILFIFWPDVWHGGSYLPLASFEKPHLRYLIINKLMNKLAKFEDRIVG